MTTTFSRDEVINTPQLVINAGVIGFGFIGEVHVRAIRASGGVVTAIAAKTLDEARDRKSVV
jgi:predicted dehydrogenase